VQISLRSHLIAGTAAVVGASAIAMTPVVAAPLTLPSVSVPAAAQVAMAAFSSPLSQLFQTLELGNIYLLDGTSPVALSGSWPFAGFGAGIPLFPAALLSDAAGGYSSVGLIPQIIDDALPIISQLGYNGSEYLKVTGDALFGAGAILFQDLWTAGGQLLALDIPGALATIGDAINSVGTLLLGAGAFVLQSVLANAQAVLDVVVGSLPTVLGVTVAQLGLVVARGVQIFDDTFAALATLDIEGAWNAVVDGLLGPSGLPGTILNLTIGAGVQTQAITAVDPFTGAYTPADAFIPSVRTEIQALSRALVNGDGTGALQTAPPPPAAAVAAVTRSAASIRSAAVSAAPAAEAPAAEAPAGDNTEAAPAAEAATAEAPAAEAAAEKPGRKAARASRGAAARG